jgi:subtilisin family serine protease
VEYYSHQIVTYVQNAELEARLDSMGFKKIDSCNCETGFALWQSEKVDAVTGIGVIADAGGKAEGVGNGTDMALPRGGIVGFNLVFQFRPPPLFLSQRGDNTGGGPEYQRLDTGKAKSFRQPSGAGVTTVKVAVVDTGVDSSFAGLNTLPSSFSVPNGCNNYPQVSPTGLDMVNPMKPPFDQNGHGTRINGILADLSRISSGYGYQSEIPQGNVRLEVINAKFTIDTTMTGSLFDAICGIYYSINQKAKVINLSWGFQSDSMPKAFLPVLKKAQDSNILIVAGAGNDTMDIDNQPHFWPAAFGCDCIPTLINPLDTIKNVLSVGAYEHRNMAPVNLLPNIAEFSNYGMTNMNIAAMGTDIYTPDVIGDTNNPKNRLSLASGTSFAAPFITRVAAILRGQKPAASAIDIKLCLTTQGKAHSTTTPGGVVKGFRFRLNGSPISGCP